MLWPAWRSVFLFWRILNKNCTNSSFGGWLWASTLRARSSASCSTFSIPILFIRQTDSRSNCCGNWPLDVYKCERIPITIARWHCSELKKNNTTNNGPWWFCSILDAKRITKVEKSACWRKSHHLRNTNIKFIYASKRFASPNEKKTNKKRRRIIIEEYQLVERKTHDDWIRFDRHYYLWPSSFLFCWLSVSLPCWLTRDSFKNGLPFPSTLCPPFFFQNDIYKLRRML